MCVLKVWIKVEIYQNRDNKQNVNFLQNRPLAFCWIETGRFL